MSDASDNAVDHAKRQFIASYRHGNSDWTLTFHAADELDAERKITSIRRTLSLDGEVAFAIRLPWFRWDLVKQWFR